jgi:DNA-binding GntR family transcriptional regulator
VIDRESDRPAFKQLADLLRARVISGQLKPGERLPSETTLSQEYDLSRNTVRRAVGLLVAEGLVAVDPPHGTFVRDASAMETVAIQPGDQVEVRGGNVVVTRAGGASETYDAGFVRIVSERKPERRE